MGSPGTPAATHHRRLHACGHGDGRRGTVTDMGGHSRIDVVTTGNLKGIWRLFAPLMKSFAGRQQKSFFEKLRALAAADA